MTFAGRERRELGLLLLFALVARLLAWVFIDGFVMPDEYFQSLEPGHHLAFGHGVLSWEWEVGIRPWAVPYAYAALFRIADLVGLSGPGDLPRLAQLVNLLLSLLIVSSSWRLGRVAGRTEALVAGGVSAVFAPLLFFAPRTLLDCGSAALLMTALARFAESVKPPGAAPDPEPSRTMLGAGVLLGVAFIFRYTAPIFFIAPALFLYVRYGFAGVRRLVLGFTLVLVALAVFDWLTWGRPLHSLVAYFSFNVAEGESARHGVEPAAWYLETLAGQSGPLWVLAVAVAVAGFMRRGALGAVGLGLALGLAAMSALAHKEERFLLPLLAATPLAFALGVTRLRDLTRRSRRLGPALAAACLALVVGSSWLAWSQRDWAPNRDWIDAMRWIGDHPGVHGVLATPEWTALGGDVVHRRNLPLVSRVALRKDRLAPGPIFDTLVTDLHALARVGWVEGTALSGFSEAARFGGVVVMRRP